MRAQQREDALKLNAIRLRIKVGIDALDRREIAEITDVDLDDYLKKLAARASGPAR